MRIRVVCIAFPAICVLVITACPRQTKPRDCQILDDPRFVEQDTTLWELVDRLNEPSIRTHAWKRYATIMGPSESAPKWLHWLEKVEAFDYSKPMLDAQARETHLHIESPAQLGAEQRLRQAVHFSDETVAHIRDRRQPLNEFKHLDKLRENGQAFIVPFPRSAEVVKSVWWPVRIHSRLASPLPVWDPLPDYPQPREIPNFPYTRWKRLVWVTASGVQPEEYIIPSWWISPAEPSDLGNRKLFSIDHFYHRPAKDEDLKELAPLCEQVYGEPCSEKDYLILVALHIATKELDDWLWMTFWWHDQPNVGEFSKNKPADPMNLKAGHFLMDVAFHPTAPRELDGRPNRTFNPWLEGAMFNGVNSNCITCHQRASWCLPNLENGGQVADYPVPPDAPFFRNKLRLDYVWSIFYQNIQGADAKIK